MKRIKYIIAALFASCAMMLAVNNAPVYADDPGGNAYSCSSHFLGLKAWYDGLLKGGTCEFDSSKFQSDSPEVLQKTIWTIVLNITSSVLGVVGYLAICFVIWGGYQYMLARGDASKVAKGKKTITNALIGLAVAMLSSTIAGMVADIVASDFNDGTNNIFVTAMNKAFTWAAIICVIIVVIGGIQYTISNGNPNAVSKAKSTITYAFIGLAISLLAIAIVNTVVSAL